jgi:hypothetical protein
MPHLPHARQDDDLFRWAAYYIRGLIRVAKREHELKHGPYCICQRAEMWINDVREENDPPVRRKG